MIRPFIACIATGLLLFSISAWSASTKDEIIELKAQVAEMQKDLQDIKKLLEEGARAPAAPQQAAFRPQTVSIGDSPVKGDTNAPVTLIEYSDYQCPYCSRNFRDVLPLLVEEYVDTGKLKFVMRENPLTAIHPQAMDASMAALCAGDQGKYWQMHDLLFENQKQLAFDNLKDYATTAGLDMTTYDECMQDKKHQATIRSDMASATKLGVRGTPGFVIGLTDKSDPNKANLSVYIRGAQGIDQFRASIDELLAEAE